MKQQQSKAMLELCRRMEKHSDRVLKRRNLEECLRAASEELCEVARKVNQFLLAAIPISPERRAELAKAVREHESRKLQLQAFDLAQQMRSRRAP